MIVVVEVEVVVVVVTAATVIVVVLLAVVVVVDDVVVIVVVVVVVVVVTAATLIVVVLLASVPAFEAVGRRIDPSQWTQLQFGLFSVPTSGPQLVYQRPWYVLFCLWKSAYKKSIAAYRKE